MMAIQASAVFCGQVFDGVIGVLFAADRDGSGVCLELQRALSFDARDQALGQDDYCLRGHTGASVYGGVVRWSVIRGLLEIDISENAAAVLSLDREMRVVFDPAMSAEVHEWLSKVLAPRAGSAR
jgi:Immunity protein 10